LIVVLTRHIFRVIPARIRIAVGTAPRSGGHRIVGALAADGESTQAAWVAPASLDDYDTRPSILRRISHALHGTVPCTD
jgi:hypothetical protein